VPRLVDSVVVLVSTQSFPVNDVEILSFNS